MKEWSASKKVWEWCLLGFFWLGASQYAVAQCAGSPITSFALEQTIITNTENHLGEITVVLQGGNAPFIYKLVADHRGKGTKEVLISSPTHQRRYTFQGVPANTDFFYQVEVVSSNRSEGAMPEAICQKRSVLNIELK